MTVLRVPTNTPEESLWYLAGEAGRLDVKDICEPVLGDSRFILWSGSSRPDQHHYGKGGLIRHVAQVAELCRINNEAMGRPVNERLLFLAALFHDVGKMWDYEPVDDTYNNWQGTTHKRRIHHISRSWAMWRDCVSGCRQRLVQQRGPISATDVDEVGHAILSHHLQREWGSPVAPNTKLAWMIHLCDQLSARMDDVGTFDRIKENKQ